MVGTPKHLRQPPPRVFENYTLVRATASSVDLTHIPEDKFKPCSPGIADLFNNDPGKGMVETGLSVPINIGFDFSLNEITYKNFAASTAGFLALIDPSQGTFNTNDVTNGGTSDAVLVPPNGEFAYNHVMIAPWFDDLRNVATSAYQLSGTHSTTKMNRITQGLEPLPYYVNAYSYGVKFCRDTHPELGRRLVVRWHSFSNFNDTSSASTVKFEAVLYENGRIEFRYSPKSNMGINPNASLLDHAAIGVFLKSTPSSSTNNRWRDFSYGLGYRDPSRQQYVYGGAVYTSSYQDFDPSSFSLRLTASYTHNLKTTSHWPGGANVGSMFAFLPPSPGKVELPRQNVTKQASRNTLPTVVRTGDRSRLGSSQISFDDRNTLFFFDVLSGSGKRVCYPTTIPRLHGDSEPNVINRQNNFTTFGLEITASTSKQSDQFLVDNVQTQVSAFSDSKLFDKDDLSDPFFSSGSSVAQFGIALKSPLWSKTQVKLSFPVNYNIVTDTTTSMIYYYNGRTGCWNVPQNSSYITTINATTNDSGYSRGDVLFSSSLQSQAVSRSILEHYRGFDPIGNFVVSGTNTISGAESQSDVAIGSQYTPEAGVVAVYKKYDKSITTSEAYRATSDETFAVPINQPFVLERAVIEIPFAMGHRWFTDVAEVYAPHETTTGSFDFGGPGITVSLFNQFEFNGSQSRRDLILTGCITHQFDNASYTRFANNAIDTTYQIRKQGMLAYGGVPAAVVPARQVGSFYTFTGSVAAKCEAQVSNGVMVKLEMRLTSSNANANRTGTIGVFNTPTLDLITTVQQLSQSCNIAYINNIGRGGTGFEPSGRSIFGKEYAQSPLIGKKVANPFYYTGTMGGAMSPTFVGIPAEFTSSINTGNTFKFLSLVSLEQSVSSPYLLLPNDKLILAVSKTRPAFFRSTNAVPYTEVASSAHDVQLITGSINIVLYGSLLRNETEYHDTNNTTLASDAIHETYIGAEPVLDQFEVPYKESLQGSATDDYVTGSLVSILSEGGNKYLVTGSRGRIFSKINARDAGFPSISSVGFNTQPWFERANSSRLSTFFNQTERIYDSMMPSLNKCFEVDGSVIWKADQASVGLSFVNHSLIKNADETGFVLFNFSNLILGTTSSITNNNWTWSYPFEPRYAGATRLRDISREFTSTSTLVELELNVTPPIQLQSIIPLFKHKPTGVRQIFQFTDLDRNVTSALASTSSMSSDDTLRVLYGFGDQNQITYVNGNYQQGANNAPSWRRISSNFTVDKQIAVQSPIIRGWKYGVFSGLASYSKAYFRQGRYGQPRDMLEQRLNTKFLNEEDNENVNQGVTTAVVNIRFVDSAGRLTNPENTWSQNLSTEATSSVPYFDGEIRNRPDINLSTLNSSIISLLPDDLSL